MAPGTRALYDVNDVDPSSATDGAKLAPVPSVAGAWATLTR